jgi:hypothetical protein
MADNCLNFIEPYYHRELNPNGPDSFIFQTGAKDIAYWLLLAFFQNTIIVGSVFNKGMTVKNGVRNILKLRTNNQPIKMIGDRHHQP